MYNELFCIFAALNRSGIVLDCYAGILLHYHLHIEPIDAIVSVIKIAIYNG